MHSSKRLLAILIALLIVSPSFSAIDLSYPYIRARVKLPPSEDPFPGLGNYYSTLSKGMKSALWNPASLGKLELSETSFSGISPMETYNYQRTFTQGEMAGTMESGGLMIDYGLFFRPPEDIATGISTEEINFIANANYGASSSGMNFTSALKINDWLMLGFASNSPIEVDFDMSGDLPTTAKIYSDLYGESMSGMQIGTNGKLQYTYTSGSDVTTYESTQSLWQGFLTQEAVIPLTTLTEFRNNFNVQSPYTGTIASKLGNLCVGLNMIPIDATANIDNDLRTVVRSDTEDMFFYTPNFDSSNQTELVNWINDPDKYGASGGYRRTQIKLPAGETIGTLKYRGYYAASTARLDFGGMYDLTDWFTIGFALENMSGSSLNFRGESIASYINYRDIDTSEAGSLEDILEPGSNDTINLITDRWVTTTEAGDYTLFLEPEKTIDLPRRLRYGFALKKPFLIAVDFEQNQTPVTVNYSDKEITISNMNLVRIGIETQFLVLPLWLRTGITLLAKPTITGLTADEQSGVDSAFQYGYLPLKVDLGTETDTWGVISGSTFGFNAQSIFNMLQFDTTNIDLSKLVYYNVYVGKDAWRLSFLSSVDPIATASAYSTKTVPDGEERQFAIADVKFIQTVGVTYRF